MESLYLERYAFPNELFENVPVSEDLGLIITIPSFHEPGLLQSLKSLKACDLPQGDTEVLIVINQPDNASKEQDQTNQETFQQASLWAKKHHTDRLKFLVSPVLKIPSKVAGVGMARKIAMDEAVRRFYKTKNKQGIITGFDADTTCSPDYMTAVSFAFQQDTSLHGASIFFEHPLEEINGRLRSGIIAYELHLRYLINALRITGYPYAFHTIGSSMAVNSRAYEKQGGMNKRKAGEDFYFLHKIMNLGNYREIHSTTVHPSARVSTRVPFGTGKAMQTWMDSMQEDYLTYDPRIFEDLEETWHFLSLILRNPQEKTMGYHRLPPSMKAFVDEAEWELQVGKAFHQTADPITFQKRLFTWLSGLKILQYVHHARDNFYPNIPVNQAMHWLFEKQGIKMPGSSTLVSMLLAIRRHDRQNPYVFKGFK